ncbi:MAG: bifunctional DNA-formamidopyrimidine glycosylase/DNA-(apurinic or apyrimidinic site) lyase [Paracoccaceae bacterium]
MPELPEVETVCRGLRIKILGKIISQYHQFREDLRWTIPTGIKERIEGTKIKKIERRGKFLLINLNNNYILIIHLGMSGRLLVYNPFEKEKKPSKQKETGVFFHTLVTLGKHDHIKIDFEDGNQMVFNDVRRFGAIDFIRSDKIVYHKWLSKLGPEPLSNNFSSLVLRKKIENKKCSIKAAILDQGVVSGIGNIYACEALWGAKISPYKICSKMTDQNFYDLVKELKNVLKKAINAGGSSLKDFKATGGELGYFQNLLSVYSRENLNCKRKLCNGNIKRQIQSGRSSFFCTNCQI